ncbi:PepSY domain-containing protein [Roseomonas sp. OT10]|uniref:PepSY-associated TM helix domain-containing protein n=1 Tax=Roseomonas cutis TaxID=2897332 RepID=UPI001E4F5F27|nr:PepSY-associated TM helix domain-containing protein [Roseomonas sp. OT10]UFN47493.1 PepSY domain-containing protein [Roseomonas sp. OT10]
MPDPSPGRDRAAARPNAPSAELKAFIARLHFYIGLFVGPFLLVAAVTGLLYVLTPQLEAMLYRDSLRTASTGSAHSLSAQAEAARAAIGPGPRLFAIRPATGEGATTQVMFLQPGLAESESRAIFVDPVTLAIRGDMTVYGTSGILPLRTTLDYLHRNLLLGEFGRLYSELAASWLWVLALGGVLLWAWRRTGALSRQNPRNARLRARRLHGLAGVAVSLGLLFLSATGLTWSQWAGGRIDGLREALGWVTPAVVQALNAPADTMGGHDHHGQNHHGEAPREAAAPRPASPADPGLLARPPEAQLDAVLAVARAAGIDSPLVEIRLPRPGRTWLVREYDRSWPTQVDTVAIDPRDLAVTSRADFATFPLVAKLIRWGIDLHMGILFGLPNQALVAAIALGLIGTIVYGYRVWWQNRPAPGALPRTLVQAWLRLGLPLRLVVLLVLAALGWALPVAGGSLLAFLLVDLARWQRASRRMATPPLPAE